MEVSFHFTQCPLSLFSPHKLFKNLKINNSNKRHQTKTILSIYPSLRSVATHCRHRLELMRQIYNSDVSPCSPLPPSPPPPPATSERPGKEEEVQTCIPGCNQAKLSLSQLLPTRLLNTRMSVSGSHLPLLQCSRYT